MAVAVSLIKNAGFAFATLGPPTVNGLNNFTQAWAAGIASDPSKKPCPIVVFHIAVNDEPGVPVVSATFGGVAGQAVVSRIAPNNGVYAYNQCRCIVVMAFPGFDVSKTTSNVVSLNVTPSVGGAYAAIQSYGAVGTIAENVDPNFNIALAITRNYSDANSPYAMVLPANSNSASVNVVPGGMLLSFLSSASAGSFGNMFLTTPSGSTTEVSNAQAASTQICCGYYGSTGGIYSSAKWTDSIDAFANQLTYGIAFSLGALPAANLAVNCDCTDTTGYDTLATLRNRMMIRLGYAAQTSNPPPGMANLLTEFLQSAQKELYHKWSALRTKRLFRWTMTPGVVMYGIRSNDEDTVCNLKLDPYKVIDWVGVQQQGNSAWTPMTEGIPPEFYTGANNLGLPTNYEIRQCIEIFPPPNASHYLWIKGHMGLQAFSADSDTPTIDSELVFLTALARGKAHYGQVDAIPVQQMATAYLGHMVAGTHGRKRYIPNVPIPGPATQPLLVLKPGQ